MLLSKPALSINISLSVEKVNPVAGARWISRNACDNCRVFTSHKYTDPFSDDDAADERDVVTWRRDERGRGERESEGKKERKKERKKK